MVSLNTAVILAGGRSTRMDFDKQTILIQGRMMPLFIADQMKPLFPHSFILSNRSELYPEHPPYPIFPDQIPDRGPKGGIYTGLTLAEDDFVYFIGCDMPFVNPDYIQYMKYRIGSAWSGDSEEGPLPQVVLARKDGYPEPLNAFYSKGLLPEITRHLEAGNNKISALYREENTIFIEEEEWRRFDPLGLMFINLNTAADYEKLYENSCYHPDFHPSRRLQK